MMLSVAQARSRWFRLTLSATAVVVAIAASWWLAARPAYALTITVATGGTAISAATAANAGNTYTTLTGPTILETAGGEIPNTGTVVLSTPAGFRYSTAAASVNVALQSANGTCPLLIDGVAAGGSINLTPTTSTITFTLSGTASSGSIRCRIVYSGIQVQPTAATPLASGNLTHTGTAAIVGVTTGSTSFGTLTEVAAAASAYRITAATTTPAAGVADQLTITLVDQYTNTVAAFSGTKTLTFAGLANGPNGSVPTVTNNVPTATNLGVATTITLTNGVSTAGGSLIAKKVETATLTATDGTLSTATTGGTGVSLTVSPGADSAITLAAVTTTPVAGASDTLTITILDAFGNNGTSGDRSLTFAGIATSPSGAASTVTNNTPTPVDLGGATLITFTSGVSADRTLVAKKTGASTLTATTTGGASTAATGGQTLGLTVSVGADAAYRIAGTAVSAAGSSNSLTITLADQFGNTGAFNGDKSLIFSGVATSPAGNVSTVSDKTGAAIALGTGTTITFTGGVSSAGGTLVARTSGGSVLADTDGTLSTGATGGAALSITVTAAADSAYRITGTSPVAVGVNDQLTVRRVDQYGNTVTGFTSNVSLTFAGIAVSPAGNASTITNSSAAATSIGVATVIHFTAGVSDVGALLVARKSGAFTLTATDGSLTTTTTGGTTFAVTVNPSAATAYRISGTSPVVIGTNDPLTISLVDQFGNADPAFTGGNWPATV